MTQLSTKLPWELAQTKWASILNPLLQLPFLSGIQINSIVLKANVNNVVNHLLQRMPQGWFLVDNTAHCTVIRAAPFTTTTITLQSDNDTTVSLWIY